MIAYRRLPPRDSTLLDLAPDLAPLLDTFFILLVFFMLTAGDTVRSLRIELPAAVSQAAAPTQDEKRILLEIGENAFAIDGEPVADFDALTAAIAQRMHSSDNELIIASDKRATVEKLLKVLTWLQSQDADVANILMRQEAPD